MLFVSNQRRILANKSNEYLITTFCIYANNRMTVTPTLPFHFELTSRGQAAAYGAVEAGLTDAGVWVQHTA